MTDDTLPDDGTTDIVEAPEPANDPVPENDPEIEGNTTNEEPA